MNSMNYYFVKDGQIVAGRINATNPKESTIMGAWVIEGKDLTITSDYTMLVPYVYIELKDAIKRAELWTKETAQILKLLTNKSAAFALIDNRVLPVLAGEAIIDNEGSSFSCKFLGKNDELLDITVHIDELHINKNTAFDALTKSLC